MNEPRRKRIREAVSYLEKARDMIDNVRDDELDAMDNMPENLQYSDRYSEMEDKVYSLGDAMERIDDAMTCLDATL